MSTNPTVGRVLRGGAYLIVARDSRSAFHGAAASSDHYGSLGMRCARD